MAYATMSPAAIALAIALATPLPAHAAEPAPDVGSRLAEMERRLQAQEQQLEAQRQEITRLRETRDENQRAQREVADYETLIDTALKDAQTRTSLQDGGMVAGVRGKQFVVGSGDGRFELRVDGGVQIRYVGAIQTGSGGPDGDVNDTGFDIRRTRLNFEGNVVDPRLIYQARLDASRGASQVQSDAIMLGLKLADGVLIYGGQVKGPFNREEMASAFDQLAAERTLVNEVTNIGFVQGGGLELTFADVFRSRTLIHDGSLSGEGNEKGFEQGDTDIAVSSRLDLMLMGDQWSQWSRFGDFRGGDNVFVGGGFHYEVGESQDPASAIESRVGATADGSFQVQGVHAFASYTFFQTNRRHASPNNTFHGVVGQAAFQLLPDLVEPFARFEFLHTGKGVRGSLGQTELFIYTVGANVFIHSAARLTIDVSYTPDRIPAPADLGISDGTLGGVGFREDSDNADGQVLLRVLVSVKL